MSLLIYKTTDKKINKYAYKIHRTKTSQIIASDCNKCKNSYMYTIHFLNKVFIKIYDEKGKQN